MNLRCYILDDEPPAIELLGRFIQRTPGLVLTGSHTRPLEALQILQSDPPDVLFLDIDLPDIRGTELALLVLKETAVVFTTAFREFGPEAFSVNACDYLLKPFTYPRFLAAIQRVRSTATSLGHVFIRTGSGQLSRVDFTDLVCVLALSNYVELHLSNHRLVTYMSLSELEQVLPAQRFSRIHRSAIIAHQHIRLVDKDEVVLSNDRRLTIGQTYRATFLDKLNREGFGPR